MIQLKRGSTEIVKNGKDKGAHLPGTWNNITLADGQPGYDKTTNRIKIGDGKTPWNKLKWLKSGLEAKQILDSEKNAKARLDKDKEDITIFTYGKADPTDKMVGQVYLHQYDGPVETDYVIETGTDLGWGYRKWYSGMVECWCTITKTNVEVNSPYGNHLFRSALLDPINYPTKISFKQPPTEIVTVVPINKTGKLEDNIPVFTCNAARNTKTTSSSPYLCGAKATTFSSVIINYIVKGYY